MSVVKGMLSVDFRMPLSVIAVVSWLSDVAVVVCMLAIYCWVSLMVTAVVSGCRVSVFECMLSVD
jgi:hypothetical protein